MPVHVLGVQQKNLQLTREAKLLNLRIDCQQGSMCSLRIKLILVKLIVILIWTKFNAKMVKTTEWQFAREPVLMVLAQNQCSY